MVVGEANKGKTSLLLSLTRRGKVTRFKEVAMDRHKEPLATNGVELGDWEYAPGRKEKVTFMTWDFGGQVREGGREGGREGTPGAVFAERIWAAVQTQEEERGYLLCPILKALQKPSETTPGTQ